MSVEWYPWDEGSHLRGFRVGRFNVTWGPDDNTQHSPSMFRIERDKGFLAITILARSFLFDNWGEPYRGSGRE